MRTETKAVESLPRERERDRELHSELSRTRGLRRRPRTDSTSPYSRYCEGHGETEPCRTCEDPCTAHMHAYNFRRTLLNRAFNRAISDPIRALCVCVCMCVCIYTLIYRTYIYLCIYACMFRHNPTVHTLHLGHLSRDKRIFGFVSTNILLHPSLLHTYHATSGVSDCHR
jgi:hypothetical protein